MKRLALLALGCGLWNWGCAMQASGESAGTKDLEILPVEVLPEYVIGFPMYVAVTLRAAEDTGFHRMVFGDIWNMRAAIGVRARGPGPPISSFPHSFIEPEQGRRAASLMPGETRRMLVDVSPLFRDAVAGTYSAWFVYTAPEVREEAKPVSIRFRKPTAEEEAFLARVAADRSKFATWTEWMMVCSEHPVDAADLPHAGPMVFAAAVKFLMCGAQPLRDVDPAALDVLQGVYAPERDLLKAELYETRGNQAAADRLKHAVREKTPGLEWWVNKGGYLKAFSRRPEQ